MSQSEARRERRHTLRQIFGETVPIVQRNIRTSMPTICPDHKVPYHKAGRVVYVVNADGKVLLTYKPDQPLCQRCFDRYFEETERTTGERLSLRFS
jgi:hypothetical protein